MWNRRRVEVVAKLKDAQLHIFYSLWPSRTLDLYCTVKMYVIKTMQSLIPSVLSSHAFWEDSLHRRIWA